MRLAALALMFLSTSAFAAERIAIGVGQQQVLVLGGAVKKVSVPDPSIADVNELSPSKLVVIGVGVGRTELTVWRKSGEVLTYKVAVRADGSRPEPIWEALGDISGVEVRVTGPKTRVEGEVQTVDDWRRVEKALADDPGVKSTIKPSRALLTSQAGVLRQRLETKKLNDAIVQVEDHSLVIVAPAKDVSKLETIVKAFPLPVRVRAREE